MAAINLQQLSRPWGVPTGLIEDCRSGFSRDRGHGPLLQN